MTSYEYIAAAMRGSERSGRKTCTCARAPAHAHLVPALGKLDWEPSDYVSKTASLGPGSNLCCHEADLERVVSLGRGWSRHGRRLRDGAALDHAARRLPHDHLAASGRSMSLPRAATTRELLRGHGMASNLAAGER